MNKPNGRLIHVAEILLQNKGKRYLFLRQINPYHYSWFEEEGQEKETPIWGATAEEAIAAARRQWKNQEFRTLNCGFRYSLPERDEHGVNALFYQMAASYQSMTGVYYEEELGANCMVQNASIEARDLLQRLQLAGRL